VRERRDLGDFGGLWQFFDNATDLVNAKGSEDDIANMEGWIRQTIVWLNHLLDQRAGIEDPIRHPHHAPHLLKNGIKDSVQEIHQLGLKLQGNSLPQESP